MALSEAQYEAVHHGKGPAMVLAGPGSGKTLVITHRVRNLIEGYRVKPDQILVITFTRAAAEEMKQRFARLMCGQNLPVRFGTFHSVFFLILRYAYRYTAASIARPEQRRAVLREALRRSGWQPDDEQEALSGIAAEISELKGDFVQPENYYSKTCPNEVLQSIYRQYNEELRQAGLIDFDDMMGMCYELLKSRKDILQAWQRRWPYILVDEFQDINRLQYEIVKMLAAPEGNLFIVGDDDQSIYRFRGARPEIMLGFPDDFPDARIIRLDINYRSVPSVVNASGMLIAQNDHRYRKKIRASAKKDCPVVAESYQNLLDENDAVIRRIQEYHRRGVPYEEMAVLYRTNRAARGMAEQMIRVNLPFVMGDLIPNIYEHWIAQDILTYMLIAAGSRRRGDFLRIINRPVRYVPRSAFPHEEVSFAELRKEMAGRDWMEDRIDRLEFDLRLIARMRPWAAVNYIRNTIGYDEFLKDYAGKRRISEEDLVSVLDEVQESARPFATLDEWMAYMKTYAEKLARQQEAGGAEGRSGVQILTMHSSKGLEFRAVFLPDVNEGVIPSAKAVLDADIEEERRLFYVAMTRAKTALCISCVRERFNRPMAPSRFLHETGLPVHEIPDQSTGRREKQPPKRWRKT